LLLCFGMASTRRPKEGCRSAPETVGTCLVDSIFVHTMIKAVCLCRVNRGRDWPASALFGRGRAVSSGRCMGKMIPAHVFDLWVLAQHTRCGADRACQGFTGVITCFPNIVIVHDSRTCLTSCRVAPVIEPVHAQSLMAHRSKIYHLEVVQRL